MNTKNYLIINILRGSKNEMHDPHATQQEHSGNSPIHFPQCFPQVVGSCDGLLSFLPSGSE